MRARTWPLLLMGTLTMCARPASRDTKGEAVSASPSANVEGAKPPPNAAKKEVVPERPANRLVPRCSGELKEATSAPALPGTPGLDAQRPWIVARNKGEPVLFIRAPKFLEHPSPVVRSYRQILQRTRFPTDFFKALVERDIDRKVLRDIVLKEGYLYGETLDLAHALYQSFEVRDLFDEPELWIERGPRRLKANRQADGHYAYASGPDIGAKARLLNFDRVGVAGQSHGPALHRDVRTVRHEMGFDRMKVERMTDTRIVVRVRYGDVWVRTLLKTDGANVESVCEEVPKDIEQRLAAARSKLEVRRRVMTALRASILAQVGEELPFDEPETEWGQEDGVLFHRWQQAYTDGWKRYLHHFDWYSVFTPEGKPRVPQVCVDFLTHTIERASGTWWAEESQPRQRVLGRVDFEALMGGERRQVPGFMDYVRAHPEQFEVKEYNPARRIYRNTNRFFSHLETNLDDFQPGDMVFIFGRAPWDHYNVPHYHGFFVYESDPMTGMPILLASNAGLPRVRSWEPEMGRAPLRGIRYRIRPRLEWLDEVTRGQALASVVPSPPPLVESIP